MEKKSKVIVGIDEVGRGPLAGPVAVCALCLQNNFNKNNFRNFKDSKKLSHKQRVEWLARINAEKEKGNIIYQVCFESNRVIDKKGIVFAIRRALHNSLKSLGTNPKNCVVLLDGGLRAPPKYKNQKTIIKGDEKKLAIALASIVAKVTRDELMKKLAGEYSSYGLEIHKGYGTKRHIKAIKKFGLSPLHRVTFCKNCQ